MKRFLLSLAIAIPLIAGCAAAGDLAKTVGSGLTDYSSRNTGFLAGAAGVAGGVYTQAGNIVSPPAEDPAQVAKKKE